MLFCKTNLTTQGIKILVLDAVDGTPQSRVQVYYSCTNKLHNSPPKSEYTNLEGFAQISFSCGDDEKIELWLTAPDRKEPCGELPPLKFGEISSLGIVSKPDAAGGIRCPTKVSEKLKPLPGQVTMFIKKPTWWQSHVAG